MSCGTRADHRRTCALPRWFGLFGTANLGRHDWHESSGGVHCAPEPVHSESCFSFENIERHIMKNRCIILTTTTLLLSGAIASAQTPARDLPDAANPNAAGPAPTGTPDRPPAASLPDASAPDPTITGQAPASSEKMQPEMDSVGGGKTAPGAEKK